MSTVMGKMKASNRMMHASPGFRGETESASRRPGKYGIHRFSMAWKAQRRASGGKTIDHSLINSKRTFDNRVRKIAESELRSLGTDENRQGAAIKKDWSWDGTTGGPEGNIGLKKRGRRIKGRQEVSSDWREEVTVKTK